ncbi:phosphoenolpyruvate carboxylase [Sandarakinorhabdus cyanobacteriorum]|uniref:Phosphoenolpyruvate carboxylase n=1 Tax=Sandarakinorhabdus cyanobacteriorum TaxID=1981098 RepID=A0A255YFZ7_9SPHN|nr:phosphoenolpyruvate carboxylase [Sandarakinorhabdus cyanobacteriorum]OYQ27614.1 phosphoenolpyruvate carboxylase [Sandarakinorhabdus cyanobacteriorum]
MIETYRQRLGELHARTAETPLFNPVFQLGLEISRALEAGEVTLAGLAGVIAELGREGLQARADRLAGLLAPIDDGANLAGFRAQVEASAAQAKAAGDFAAFRARWEAPLLHIVFTAHPTFLLTPAEYGAVAGSAVTGVPVALATTVERPSPALEDEHGAVLAAITRAMAARDRLHAVVLEVAAAAFPDQWRDLTPCLFRLATWVGYDMDGRTDIGWATSLRFRAEEKAVRLGHYAEAAAALGEAALAQRLRQAATQAAGVAALLAGDTDDPAALSAIANRVTAGDADALTSLTPIIADLRTRGHLGLAAAMAADGLGMGHIHFRVNAAQLHNAIRRRIDGDGGLDSGLDLGSGQALIRLRRLLAEVKPLRSNFAALAVESTTAVRQFLAMAAMLKHIDEDAPIRLLIAECEQPQTVLAALYFARLFGIDHKVDVSPLFETETALEHGGRFLDALLAEPAYRAHARLRGRVAIQTGFSDAGRFVGQIPAALAIERLQGRLARAMKANGLADVAALIFNTHGESMGRGAHPASFTDRLAWPLSRWARAQFAAAGIRVEAEASFQGGDGFLFFGADALALATLTRIADITPGLAEGGAADEFYTRTDLSLDYYRMIRRHQRGLFEARPYARAITAFGLGLIPTTGSRRLKRQSDLGRDRDASLRSIRAIPHNAILQQLGYPVNVLAGVGTAAAGAQEGLGALMSGSARGRQILGLVGAANAIASIKTLAAYGELFNSAYWATRPYRGTEMALARPCLALAERLVEDDRSGQFRRLASMLRVDNIKLRQLLAHVPEEAVAAPAAEATRRTLGVLHAVRLGLMQHMFLRVVEVPAFSARNDISRDDVIEMILSLRVDEALAQLRRAFPVSAPDLADYAMAEPSDWPDGDPAAYAGIQRRFIAPIAEAARLIPLTSIAIANHFGAHG